MMQQELSKVLPFFEEAVKRTDKVYFAYDVGGKQFLYLSPAFEQVLERPAADIAKKPDSLLEIAHPDDREYLTNIYREILNGEEKKEVEFRIRLSEENFRWLMVHPF